MPKGKPNKHYTGEFKQQVIETMLEEKLSYSETIRKFDISTKGIVKRWERIYLEEGSEGPFLERRGRACSASGTQKGRTPSLQKEVEVDLIAEVQRLRAEVEYLKNYKPCLWTESDISGKDPSCHKTEARISISSLIRYC